MPLRATFGTLYRNSYNPRLLTSPRKERTRFTLLRYRLTRGERVSTLLIGVPRSACACHWTCKRRVNQSFEFNDSRGGACKCSIQQHPSSGGSYRRSANFRYRLPGLRLTSRDEFRVDLDAFGRPPAREAAYDPGDLHAVVLAFIPKKKRGSGATECSVIDLMPPAASMAFCGRTRFSMSTTCLPLPRGRILLG
ncbi:hypothetical protein BJ546DRAFT_64089 [Cryomyces antarcticus]